jgi:uncharacterized protein YbaR (Trm112 family)
MTQDDSFIAPTTATDRRMLEALVCPRTESVLRYDPSNQELISDQAQLAFPIRDGIPIMLISAARPLE